MTIKSVGKNCIVIRLFLVKNNVYTVINNTHLGLDISHINIILYITCNRCPESFNDYLPVHGFLPKI